MPIDVPAHVEYAPYIENHVQVDAGNNWDFSRTARVTPIAAVVDPEPVVTPVEAPSPRFMLEDAVPEGEPSVRVHFTHEGITIGKADQKALKALPKGTPLVVVAHGDAGESDANRLSRIRAKAVTTFLRSNGFTVAEVKAFGSTRPVPNGTAKDNRVVEVYVDGAAQ